MYTNILSPRCSLWYTYTRMHTPVQHIRAYMVEHRIQSFPALQQEFTARIVQQLQRLQRTVAVWGDGFDSVGPVSVPVQPCITHTYTHTHTHTHTRDKLSLESMGPGAMIYGDDNHARTYARSPNTLTHTHTRTHTHAEYKHTHTHTHIHTP